MFFRIAPLFLIDPGSNGGLSLSPQELGLAQGSLGAFAAIFGCALGAKSLKEMGFEEMFVAHGHRHHLAKDAVHLLEL